MNTTAANFILWRAGLGHWIGSVIPKAHCDAERLFVGKGLNPEVAMYSANFCNVDYADLFGT